MVEAGASASVGAATASVNAWPTVYGPLPVLLSVAETFRLKLPTWVGMPDTVTVLAVVPVTDRPAGRLLTWKADHGVAPPLKVNVWVYATPTVAAKPPPAVIVITGSCTVTLTVAGAEVPPPLVAV